MKNESLAMYTFDELADELLARSTRLVIIMNVDNEDGPMSFTRFNGTSDEIVGMMFNETMHQSMSFHEDRSTQDDY